MFRKVGKGVHALGLGHFEDTKSPVILCALGGLCISILGVLVPPTMFWAEFEIGSIAEPGKDLPHIWPQVNRPGSGHDIHAGTCTINGVGCRWPLWRSGAQGKPTQGRPQQSFFFFPRLSILPVGGREKNFDRRACCSRLRRSVCRRGCTCNSEFWQKQGTYYIALFQSICWCCSSPDAKQ